MYDDIVSTHSRLKAAGSDAISLVDAAGCFNTQPPEGGWLVLPLPGNPVIKVSTHSRLKAAGEQKLHPEETTAVSTHSRLKAAGTKGDNAVFGRVSFNTQPPEGGWPMLLSYPTP